MRKWIEMAAVMSLFILGIGCNHSVPNMSGTSTAYPQLSSHPGWVTLDAHSSQLRQIRVEPVETMLLPQDEIKAPGKIEANPNQITKVFMPVAGRIRNVLVKLGDSVQQDQPILTIDSPEAGAALSAYSQAQAQLRQAKSQLSKNSKDLERVNELYQHGAEPLKEVAAAENDVAQAQALVDQAQAACSDANHRLSILGLTPGQEPSIVVRSPLTGKVLELSVVPGEYRNDTSASLMTIADLRTVWITADVPESSIRLIKLNEPVQVELQAFPGELFESRVMNIADVVDPQTRTVKVHAELKNPAGSLRPDMFGSILHAHGDSPWPVVPPAAIVQGGSTTTVYREKGVGIFEPVQVKIGEIRGGKIPILSGIKSGERVVVEGAVFLKAN